MAAINKARLGSRLHFNHKYFSISYFGNGNARKKRSASDLTNNSMVDVTQRASEI